MFLEFCKARWADNLGERVPTPFPIHPEPARVWTAGSNRPFWHIFHSNRSNLRLEPAEPAGHYALGFHDLGYAVDTRLGSKAETNLPHERTIGGGWEGGGEEKTMIYRIRFSYLQISNFRFLLVGTYFRKNMLVRYRRINTKGVLERPGTKWKVLRPFLIHWNSENHEKWTFWCHVRSNRVKNCVCVFVWSVRSPWTPPDLPNLI